MSTKRKTTEQFIKEACLVHGNKYDYSKVEYINQGTEVCIICPIHGEFWQQPKTHLRGHGCFECAKDALHKSRNKSIKKNYSRRESIKKEGFKPNKEYKNVNIKTNDEFINYATKLHKGKYDYSETDFKNFKDKVKIICHAKDKDGVEHGLFEQVASQHLIGHGCPKCARKLASYKQSFHFDDFVKFAKEKYGEKFLYDKSNFVNLKTKIKIKCPEHGEFWQSPLQHLKACGCVQCVSENKRQRFAHTKEDFIEKAKAVHHDKYNYDEVEYINNTTKVKIKCPKHDIFLCTPANHLKGRGCPICKAESFVYEDRLYRLITNIVDECDIIRQYKSEWLKNNKSIDFFLPKYNIAIEHQGSQHFMPVKYLGGLKKHLRCKELDYEKFQECENNNVKLFYFSYEKNTVPEEYLDKVYTQENEFINVIKKYIENYEQ